MITLLDFIVSVELIILLNLSASSFLPVFGWSKNFFITGLDILFSSAKVLASSSGRASFRVNRLLVLRTFVFF